MFCFRQFEKEDLNNATYLFQKSFLQAPWHETWSYQQAYERLSEIMSARSSKGYMVYDHDLLIGMILGRVLPYMGDKEMIVEEVCISEKYQGQGLGTQLFDFMKKECLKEHITYLSLNTIRGFLSDQFYYKNGFREQENIVCMHCQLQSSIYYGE